jgi:hypothetical protein
MEKQFILRVLSMDSTSLAVKESPVNGTVRGASLVARVLGGLGLGVGGYAARDETTENSLKSRNSSISELSNSENSKFKILLQSSHQ